MSSFAAILVAGLATFPVAGVSDMALASQKATATMAEDQVPPLPRPRPSRKKEDPAAKAGGAAWAPLPRARPDPDARSAPAAAGLPRLTRGEHAACMEDLEAAGIVAEVLPPIEEGACGMRWPLRLTAIGDGAPAISLSPAAKVRCPIADALAAWMEEAVQPAAKEHLGGRIKGLRVAGSYVCRNRNHQPGARLSEHSVGNAIDIAAFEMAGREWVAVGPREDDEAPDARFLNAVREAACTHFHTVLGPGSDAFHTDHFHLDLARCGQSGTRRYCR
jgi:hypothetical protein